MTEPFFNYFLFFTLKNIQLKRENKRMSPNGIANNAFTPLIFKKQPLSIGITFVNQCLWNVTDVLQPKQNPSIINGQLNFS